MGASIKVIDLLEPYLKGGKIGGETGSQFPAESRVNGKVVNEAIDVRKPGEAPGSWQPLTSPLLISPPPAGPCSM